MEACGDVVAIPSLVDKEKTYTVNTKSTDCFCFDHNKIVERNDEKLLIESRVPWGD